MQRSCHACGTELPDRAKFCLECGSPQGRAAERNDEVHEICEVQFREKVGFIRRQWWLEAALRVYIW